MSLQRKTGGRSWAYLQRVTVDGRVGTIVSVHEDTVLVLLEDTEETIEVDSAYMRLAPV